ncbi:unnamed protein product [Schistosoma turkestanicum]|nr:unnamed protein product [Schistosoma turkestanicum]
MSVLSNYVDWMNGIFRRSMERADPRVSSWFLMGSVNHLLFVITAYLFMIFYGLKFMKGRHVLGMNRLVSTYDWIMVVMNAYIVYESICVAYKENYSIFCQKVDYSSNPNALRLARAVWLFHISKVIECLDTFFFIIRGRTHLVTWLHIYHHCTMIPLTWAGVKWVAGGEIFQPVAINSTIHVIMYSYYALAALGPNWRKYLWWKRYLTMLQMIQFTYGMFYSFMSLYSHCTLSKYVYYFNVFYDISLLLLFYNHYQHAYHKSNQQKLSKSTDDTNSIDIQSNGNIKKYK